MRILIPLSFVLICSYWSCQRSAPAPPVLPYDPAALEKVRAFIGYLEQEDPLPDPDTAIIGFEAVRREAARSQPNPCDTLLATACHKLGSFMRSHRRYAESRQYSMEGLTIRQRLFEKGHRDILRLYHNIGNTYFDEGNFSEALNYFALASELNETSSPIPYIPNLIVTGRAYGELQELPIARKYFAEAWKAIQQDQTGKVAGWAAEFLQAYSDCLRQLHEFEGAVQMAEQSIRWPEADTATAYLYTGNAWQDSMLYCRDPKDREEARQLAIEFTQKAYSLYQNGQRTDKLEHAASNLGELYRRAGAYQQAEAVLTATIASVEHNASTNNLVALLHLNRGETWYNRKAYARALADYEQALHHLAPAYQPGRGHPLPSLNSPILDRSNLVLLLSDMALVYLDSFERRQPNQPELLEQAVTIYDTLITLVNRMRGDFIMEGSKIALGGETQNHLRKAFEVCLRLKESKKEPRYWERAFRIAEQSKGFALLEAVRMNDLGKNLPPELQKKERALAKRGAEIQDSLYIESANAATRARLEQQWYEHLEASRKFQKALQDEQRSYYDLKYAGATLTIDTIQKHLLAERQGLVEFFNDGDSILHIFLITKEFYDLRSLPIDRRFLASVDTLRGLLSEDSLVRYGLNGQSREPLLCRKAHELYQSLLAPWAGRLPERLIIIPDAPLHGVPFEALLVADPGSGGFQEQARQKNFLLFHHTLSYGFSANLLWIQNRKEVSRLLRRDVAAFAPGFPARMVAGTQTLPEPLLQALPALRSIVLNRKEGRQLVDSCGSGRLYEDAGATKAAFFAACRRHCAVHVATHGILNNQDPNFNFISFHQKDSVLNKQELLFLTELYGEQLPLELVVFSACETAKGKYVAGEGNMSMARGLAYSGVKSFITTLWAVSTQSNQELMPKFYRQLAGRGQAKDVALAEAKRAYVQGRGHADPYLWAGPVLIGASNHLQLDGGSGWNWLVLAGALVVILFFFLRRRRR